MKQIGLFCATVQDWPFRWVTRGCYLNISTICEVVEHEVVEHF